MKKRNAGILKQNNHDPGDKNPESQRRIFIVDDDAAIRDIFRLIFEREGYIADIRGDGGDILNNRFEMPDVFLIDKQLSGCSGLDLCRFLKSQALTKNIPVVMISASPDIGKLSKDAGADDFMEKPFGITYLLELINYHIDKKATSPEIILVKKPVSATLQKKPLG